MFSDVLLAVDFDRTSVMPTLPLPAMMMFIGEPPLYLSKLSPLYQINNELQSFGGKILKNTV